MDFADCLKSKGKEVSLLSKSSRIITSYGAYLSFSLKKEILNYRDLLVDLYILYTVYCIRSL